MSEQSHNPSIEPELEARIVALVLGEASDFERDELNRQIEQRPELAAFRLRMQSVHGLLQDVGTGDFEAPDENWKLASDRRNVVLAVIRGEATFPAATEEVGHSVQLRFSVIRRLQRNLTKVAAVVCIAGFIGIMALQSFHSQERAASEYFDAAAKTDTSRGKAMVLASAGPDSQREESRRSGIQLHDDFYLSDDVSLSLAREPENAGVAVQLFAGSTSGNIDYKKNSETALSALQSTLNGGAMAFSSVGQADDFGAIASNSGWEVTEDSVAQHGVDSAGTGTSTGTVVGLGNVRFEDGAVLSSPATDPNGIIARNDAARSARAIEAGDRDGLADSKPAATTGGEVDFPSHFDSWDEGKESARAGALWRLDTAPDGEPVLLGAITTPAASDSAPIGRGLGFSTPQTLAEGEEVIVGTTSPDLATNDLGSQLRYLKQSEARLGFPNPGEPDVDFSKDQSGLPTDEYRTDFEQLVNESEPGDSLSPANSAAGYGMADKNLESLSRKADEGIDTAAPGSGGFGGGLGGMGLGRPDVPSSHFSLEMPTDASGEADQIPEGIANFDVGGSEQPSRADVAGRGSVARTKAAADSEGKQSLESLLEAIPQPDEEVSGGGGQPSASPGQPMALYDEEQKLGKSFSVYNEEVFGEKENRDAAQSAGGVALGDRIGMDFDFNVQDPIGTPTETPAFGSRQLTIPEAKTGGVGAFQYNHKSESTRSAAPATEKPADRGGLPIIDGLNSVDDGTSRTWELENKQEFEGQRESGVKGQTHSFYQRFRFGDVPRTLDDDPEPKKKSAAKTVAPSAGLNETTAAAEAFSTFSLHVSDVSFKLAAAALARGEWPDAAQVRIEEFVNAFDYGDPLPCNGERVACRVEQSIHPFVQQRNLLRVSMRTAAEGRASNTPLRLTFLLDNSGSMERTDRQQTVRRAFDLLAQQLIPIDQVTLIGFARQPRLLADKVSGAESGQLVRLIDELPSEGGTNIEAALQLAFEKAQEQLTPDAQNRIILLTDGAVNLGDADPESLSRMVSTIRDAGIAFDAAGISAEGLNDEVLEALTRKGDGRYYLLDSFESADDGFARQIAGALRPSAKNVKVQIEFNPKRVGSYKLLGFEKHILKQEDFRNDSVDAAEMAAAEAGVALYQFEATPDGEGDVGSVSVRFRDLSTGQMIENRWPIPYEADAPRADQAAPSLRIATSAALLAAKLRGEPLGETVDLQALSHLISGLPEQERSDTRVQQLKQMIEQARQISEK